MTCCEWNFTTAHLEIPMKVPILPEARKMDTICAWIFCDQWFLPQFPQDPLIFFLRTPKLGDGLNLFRGNYGQVHLVHLNFPGIFLWDSLILFTTICGDSPRDEICPERFGIQLIGRNPAPPGIVKNPVNNEINYQPQLVSWISFIKSITGTSIDGSFWPWGMKQPWLRKSISELNPVAPHEIPLSTYWWIKHEEVSS